LADPSAAPPTAQQFSRAEHDTPLRNESADPATLGLAVSVHLLPFQRSIKVRVTPDAVWSPTAQQELTRGQVTPLRTRPLGAAAASAGGTAADITASRAAGSAKTPITDRYARASRSGPTS
jgi:hypothetical protein